MSDMAILASAIARRKVKVKRAAQESPLRKEPFQRRGAVSTMAQVLKLYWKRALINFVE